MCAYVHTDRWSAFQSYELKSWLHSNGVATSRTTSYNPRGNGQCERYNGTIWKAIQCCLKSRKLPITHWEDVVTDALHSIRSLLCTATNCTPHERMFKHNRRSATGTSIPSWLKPGPIYVKRHVRNKDEPLVDEAELLETNPNYAHIRFHDGSETTVSIRDISPRAIDASELHSAPTDGIDRPDNDIFESQQPESNQVPESTQVPPNEVSTDTDFKEIDSNGNSHTENHQPSGNPAADAPPLRRSTRARKAVDR